MKLIKKIITVITVLLSISISAQTNIKDQVHFVAEVSNNSLSVGESSEVVYKLYIPHGVGVSNWKELEKPKVKGIKSEFIEIKPQKVEFETYKGVKYRMVRISKASLKAIKKGTFKLNPFKLNVTIETSSKNLDQYGRPIINKEDKIFESNLVTIRVK